MNKFSPKNDILIVEPVSEEMSEGGIYVRRQGESPTTGKILDACDGSEYKKDMVIVFTHYKMIIDNVLFVHEEDVLAVIEQNNND